MAVIAAMVSVRILIQIFGEISARKIEQLQPQSKKVLNQNGYGGEEIFDNLAAMPQAIHSTHFAASPPQTKLFLL
jgi:hypothetical protein